MADTLHSIVLIGPVAAPSSDWPESAYGGGPAYGDIGYAAPASAYAAVSADPLPTALGTLFTQSFLYDYYFRIWVIPVRIDVRNPQPGIDIPFAIWNAFPESNDLTEINTQGATDVTLDLAPVSTFFPIEYREVNIQVNEGSTGNILALFDFIFEQGHELFTFSAIRSSVVPIIPEVPVEEVWQWLTDIHVSDDGTEQRISLRGTPRRTTKTVILATSLPSVQEKLGQLLKDMQGEVYIPYFQYATPITVAMNAGDTAISFDPARTDLRADDFAILFIDEQTYALVQMDSVGVSGGVLSSPTTIDIPKGALIVPTFPSVINNGYSVNRWRVDVAAQFTLNSRTVIPREQFARPGSTAVVNTFEGYPILERRAVTDSQVMDSYDSGVEVFDYATGVTSQITEWDYSRYYGNRMYLIQRHLKPQEMDYWRDFLSLVKGQQKPFLMHTFRSDLQLEEMPLLGADTLLLQGSRYSTIYKGVPSYERIRITTTAGTHDCRIIDASPDEDGNDVITVSPNLPGAAGWDQVSLVSFLMKVRLGSDDIKLLHYGFETTIGLSIRTLPE